MKIKEFCCKNKKKVILLWVSLAMVAAGGATVYGVCKDGEVSFASEQGEVMNGAAISEEMVSAYGITSVGMTEESFEVENLESTLDIEEVYVSSNEEIEEGTMVLKLSEESVAEARGELEKKLREADLAYRAGAIEYEQSQITAKYDRDIAVLSGEQAEAVYQQTITNLESNVERAQEELSQAQEQIAEYQEALSSSSLYDYYQVEEYKQLYDENLQLLKDKMTEWGIGWSQVTSGVNSVGGNASFESSEAFIENNRTSAGNNSVSGGDVGSDIGSYTGNSTVDTGSNNTGSSDNNGQVTILRSLYSVLEQNLADYEQALSSYEDATANAAFEMQTLELSLSSLQKTLEEAQENYETQLLEAKLTYEKALAGAQRAESDYETALEKAESDFETLREDREDAQMNLELFESSVGDGCYYASGSGTILRTMVRAGQTLGSDSVIFIYSNPEEMTVTVSVEQDNIAKIAVGDSAYIQSTEYGSFQGTVTQINPVSSSDSRTSVTYNVIVTLSGNTGELAANETVTVIFGVGGAANE